MSFIAKKFAAYWRIKYVLIISVAKSKNRKRTWNWNNLICLKSKNFKMTTTAEMNQSVIGFATLADQVKHFFSSKSSPLLNINTLYPGLWVQALVMVNSFLDPSTASMLYSWFYLVCLIILLVCQICQCELWNRKLKIKEIYFKKVIYSSILNGRVFLSTHQAWPHNT